MIETHTLPDGTAVLLPGIVPKLSATPGTTHWLGPALGEHTREFCLDTIIPDHPAPTTNRPSRD
jgi:formyl-CoA transferase